MTTPRASGCADCRGSLDTPTELTAGICSYCAPRHRAQAAAARRAAPAEGFTAAERSLIGAMHTYMPASQLLQILNSRRAADRGAVVPYTLEQLQAEVDRLKRPRAGEPDWGGLRAVLAAARRDGTLAALTPQVLTDFAVVFRLTPAQTTHLRDVVASAREDA